MLLNKKMGRDIHTPSALKNRCILIATLLMETLGSNMTQMFSQFTFLYLNFIYNEFLNFYVRFNISIFCFLMSALLLRIEISEMKPLTICQFSDLTIFSNIYIFMYDERYRSKLILFSECTHAC